MPRYAIANNYCFGTPPTCLLELTDIELALLTPVKTYGYCFCYTGGVQKQLKGSLSYYKIKISSIVRSVMHFDVLNMTNNKSFLLSGDSVAALRLGFDIVTKKVFHSEPLKQIVRKTNAEVGLTTAQLACNTRTWC